MGATIDELEIKITSNAGGVSRSITTLTDRLTTLQKTMDIAKFEQLAQSLDKCGKGFKTMRENTKGLNGIGKNINSLGDATNKLNKSNPSGFFSAFSKGSRNSAGLIGSLTAAIGRFYATWFLVIRGLKKLGSAIKSSMDYIETFNYFNAAMEQIGEKAVDSWGKSGKESAKQYAEEFSKESRKVIAQLTGYEVDANGDYKNSELYAGLGMNIQDVMKYSAQFSQMSSSMGVSSKNAIKLSEVMLKLGADMASVRNLDFTEVWNNLSSGLVGQSRVLDKYGVNIRNANMQQELENLGIEANIQKLGQQDKALLRTIILLKNTGNAHADLADTINQPANMLRLLGNNFKMLGQSIGVLFLPIVKTVLPWINALTVAFKNFFDWIAKLLGISFSDFASEDSLKDETWMSELEDDAEGTEDALGGAAANAKKLKQQLLGIDELNNLTSKDDKSGSGVGASNVGSLLEGAFNAEAEKYLALWDAAEKRVDHIIQRFAKKIEPVFRPVKKLIEDIINGDWEAVGKDFSDIFSGVFDFLSDEIDNVDWLGIGRKIGDFLYGLEWTTILKSTGNFFVQIFKAALELWSGSFREAPLETAFITAFSVLKFTGLGKFLAGKIWNAIGVGLSGVITSVGGIGNLLTLDVTALVGETGLATLGALVGAGIIGGVIAAFVGWDVGQALYEWITGEDIEMTFTEQMATIFSSFTDGTWIDALKLWGEDMKQGFKDIGTEIGKIWQDNIAPVFDKMWIGIKKGCAGAINNVIGNFEMFLHALGTGIENQLFIINAILKALGKEEIAVALKEIKLPRVPEYANGGVVEDGLFRANHNELIGGFNGKTAVANNEQITEGIAMAVRDANAENNSLMREQNDILLGILSKTGITDREIYDSVRRTNAVMKRATGIGLA